MAVFTESRESEVSNHGDGDVRIVVTDGHDSFEGFVRVAQIKGERWDSKAFTMQQKIDALTSYLLDDKQHPNIMIALNLDESPSCTIRLDMTKRTENGMVVRVFSTVMKLPQTDKAAGSMSFCLEIASAFQQERNQVKQLEEELTRAQADAEIWKDTAKKQEQASQIRCDEMLNNFLVLYQATHKKMKEAKLQAPVQRASVSATSASAPKVAKRPPLPSDLAGVEDDDDVEMYDDETVNKLAVKGMSSRVKSDPTEEEHDRKRRRNQVSSDTNNFLEDTEPEEMDQKPPANPRGGIGRSTNGLRNGSNDEAQRSEHYASANGTNIASENEDNDLGEQELLRWMREAKAELPTEASNQRANAANGGHVAEESGNAASDEKKEGNAAYDEMDEESRGYAWVRENLMQSD
jgi:hypothetical protein